METVGIYVRRFFLFSKKSGMAFLLFRTNIVIVFAEDSNFAAF